MRLSEVAGERIARGRKRCLRVENFYVPPPQRSVSGTALFFLLHGGHRVRTTGDAHLSVHHFRFDAELLSLCCNQSEIPGQYCKRLPALRVPTLRSIFSLGSGFGVIRPKSCASGCLGCTMVAMVVGWLNQVGGGGYGIRLRTL